MENEKKELGGGLGVSRHLYTYVVEHENDDALRFRADMTVNGGKLQAVAFYDALERLEIFEEALDDLKIHGTPVVDGWVSVPVCEWEQVFERIGWSGLTNQANRPSRAKEE